MTKDEATTFKYYSAKNARILRSICPECRPYKDWFTYNRWQAQKEQVAKGEKGTKIITFKEVEKINEGGEKETETVLVITTVFCRHQLA